jgi:phenylacetate-CoA ligase
MINLFRVVYLLGQANRRLHWSREKLKRFQDKRIRQVVRNAYNSVPFYNRFFRENNIDLEEIRGIEDLLKLPIIRKEEFKNQNPRDIVSDNYDLAELKKVRTSGSTGKPFEVYIDSKEDSWRKAIYMRANINCGQKLRDKWLVMTSPHHFNDTTGIQRKFGIYAQTCISLFESTDNKINQITALNPDILDGYSGSLVLLAKEVKRRGVKSIDPKVMFGSAESIDVQSRRFLEKVFDAPYCDQYGAAEVDRSAWQCLERDEYHMDADSVITEFVDKDGKPVANGEKGEVVYTSLFNFAMPFIRYAIGDIGIPSENECSCGITLPLMKGIEGRKDSFLTLPGNRIISPMIFNFAFSSFKYYNDVNQYRVKQRKTDLFEVDIEMVRGSFVEKEVEREFKKHIKKFIDIGEDEVRFDVSFVKEMPMLPTGKLMSVTSDVKAKVVG